MLFAVLLTGGAVLLGAGESLALAAGGIETLNGTLSTLGYLAVAAGIWALKSEPGLGRVGRVGVLMTAFGMAAFGTAMILAMSAGIRFEADIATTPFVLMAAFFLIIGLGGLAAFFWRDPDYPNLMGVAFGVLAAAQFVSVFLPGAQWLRAGLTLALAAAVLTLAILLISGRRP